MIRIRFFGPEELNLNGLGPARYTSNHEAGVDVFEIVDSVAMRFSILNAVCVGTTYDQAWIVRESLQHSSCPLYPVSVRFNPAQCASLTAHFRLAQDCSTYLA